MQSKKEKSKDPFIGYKLELASSIIKGMYPRFFKIYTDKSDSFISRILSRIDNNNNHIKKETFEIIISTVSRDIPSVIDYVARTNVSLKRVIKNRGKYEIATCISCNRRFIKSSETTLLVCRECLRNSIIKDGLKRYNFEPVEEIGGLTENTEKSLKCLSHVVNSIYTYYKARDMSISAVKPASKLFESLLWVLGETVANGTFHQSYIGCLKSLGISPVSFKRKIFADILISEQDLSYEKVKGIRMPISDNILDFLYFLYVYTGRPDTQSRKHEARKASANSIQGDKAKGRKPLRLSLPNCPSI